MDLPGRDQPRPQPATLPQRQEALAQRIAARTAPAPVPTIEPDDELTALVAALPQQQRLALSLFYFADLSIAEWPTPWSSAKAR